MPRRPTSAVCSPDDPMSWRSGPCRLDARRRATVAVNDLVYVRDCRGSGGSGWSLRTSGYRKLRLAADAAAQPNRNCVQLVLDISLRGGASRPLFVIVNDFQPSCSCRGRPPGRFCVCTPPLRSASETGGKQDNNRKKTGEEQAAIPVNRLRNRPQAVENARPCFRGLVPRSCF